MDFKYLIIGAGMTGHAAAMGIRQIDPAGSIGMIGAEADPPYNRPPLTKGLWKGQPEERIWRPLESLKVSLLLRRKVERIDRSAHLAIDETGEVHRYQKLLLAVGGTPRRLPFGGNDIIYYRTFSDYQTLRKLADTRRRFAVIGGGFIGSEIAAALALQGREVTILFPDPVLCARVFPSDLGEVVMGEYRRKGVALLPGHTAIGLEPGKDGLVLRVQGVGDDATAKGAERELVVDAVVAGLGIQPNVDLARAAGLPTGDGIQVDDELRAGDEDIFAAGDVAGFHNSALGERIRVEHEDAANTMGLAAGRNMAGAGEKFDALPFFYSDLFDYGYEAVGRADARLSHRAFWAEPFVRGCVAYLKDGRLRGALLWNVWEKVDAARKLIGRTEAFDEELFRRELLG